MLLSWSLPHLTDFSLGILLKQENPGVTEKIRKIPHGLKDKNFLTSTFLWLSRYCKMEDNP